MKHVLLAFAIVWETSSMTVTRCPVLDGINISTVSTQSIKYIPACIEENRELHKSKEFAKREEAEKYLKLNPKKFPGGQVVEIK